MVFAATLPVGILEKMSRSMSTPSSGESTRIARTPDSARGTPWDASCAYATAAT